jgi:signal peptidase II
MDFLDLHLFGYHWPAFNVADAAISLGAVALVLQSLFGRAKTH